MPKKGNEAMSTMRSRQFLCRPEYYVIRTAYRGHLLEIPELMTLYDLYSIDVVVNRSTSQTKYGGTNCSTL
jgi:hypothetical protein